MKSMILAVMILMFAHTTFSRGNRRAANQNAVLAALQSILGPQAYEKAAPILPVPNRWSPTIEEVVPVISQRTIPREVALPSMRLIEPNCPYQMEGLYPIVAEFGPKNIAGVPIGPNIPAPTIPLAQMAVYPQAVPEIVTLPVPYPLSTVQEKRGCSCISPSPAPVVSPFLPSASPVSPWAPPTSNLLPPVVPNQVRSHFLRKIPIPPPTL